MMEHDSQSLLNLEEGTKVIILRRKADSTGVWRVCGVFLTLALCGAAAVCFTLNKSQNNQESGTVLRLMRDHQSQDNFTSKAAIHLTGGYDPKHPKYLDWKVNQDQAFSSGFELVEREIIIPANGLYFVYSQVSFHISCMSGRTKNHDIVHMSHTVLRFSDSYGGYKALFSALRSSCVHASDTEDLSYNTIYLGAAFQLLAGDRLGTHTTEALLPSVENENGKTFFGVFAL